MVLSVHRQRLAFTLAAAAVAMTTPAGATEFSTRGPIVLAAATEPSGWLMNMGGVLRQSRTNRLPGPRPKVASRSAVGTPSEANLVVDDSNLVVVTTESGELRAIRDGKEVWSAQTGVRDPIELSLLADGSYMVSGPHGAVAASRAGVSWTRTDLRDIRGVVPLRFGGATFSAGAGRRLIWIDGAGRTRSDLPISERIVGDSAVWHGEVIMPTASGTILAWTPGGYTRTAARWPDLQGPLRVFGTSVVAATPLGIDGQVLGAKPKSIFSAPGVSVRATAVSREGNVHAVVETSPKGPQSAGAAQVTPRLPPIPRVVVLVILSPKGEVLLERTLTETAGTPVKMIVDDAGQTFIAGRHLTLVSRSGDVRPVPQPCTGRSYRYYWRYDARHSSSVVAAIAAWNGRAYVACYDGTLVTLTSD